MAGADEEELGALLRERSLERAATRAIEIYGAELYGFLVHLLGDESAADEVWAQTVEDLWRGLPTFSARCSVRTWLYVLARHAAARYRRTPFHRAARRAGDSKLDGLVDRARSRTQPWQRTEIKDRLRDLRESLDDEARCLLALRLDRGMSWQEIARVTLGVEAPEPRALARESDRLRKRFQLLKEDLRARARASGLLDEDP